MNSDQTAEILNYLSALKSEVGELQAELQEARSSIRALQGEVREINNQIARAESTGRQTRAFARV